MQHRNTIATSSNVTCLVLRGIVAVAEQAATGAHSKSHRLVEVIESLGLGKVPIHN